MLKLLQCEFIKLKRSKFLMIGILGTLIVPFFVITRSVINCVAKPGTAISLFTLYDNTLMFLMLLFAPMVLTILSSWVIIREYSDGTLKNIFVIPVSRTAFLTGKLLFSAILAFLFMLVSWLEILVLALLCGIFLPVVELTLPSCLFFLMKMLLGGFFLCATQTPFLFLAVRTRSFMAPLIAIAAVSLVNVVLSNSPIAGFYPWSASYLLVAGRLSGLGCPRGVSLAVIAVMCIWGIAASAVHFRREVF